MAEPVFAAEPVRLLISTLFIGIGEGMSVPIPVFTVEKRAGEILQGLYPAYQNPDK